MRKDLKPDLQKSVSVVKSDTEWRKTLSPEEFRITREHGHRTGVQSPVLSRETRGNV